jgi:hypothetical protein
LCFYACHRLFDGMKHYGEFRMVHPLATGCAEDILMYNG